MLLIIYLALLALVFLISRGWKAKHRTVLILGYNFLYLLLTELLIRMTVMKDPVIVSVGRSLYSTVQGITFDDSSWVAAAGRADELLETQLWLIIFFAGAFTLQSVLLAFFYRTFAQARLALRVKNAKNQLLIVGRVDDAKRLVKDTLKNNRRARIIYIPTDTIPEDSELYKTCRVEKEDYLNHLRRRANYTVILLPEDDYRNLERVNLLNEWAGKNNKNKVKIKVSVFMENNLRRFRDFKANNLDTCVFSREEVAVRSFLDECQPIDTLIRTNSFEKNGLPYLTDPFKLCVIGFSSIAQEFLLLTYENTAFLTKEEGVKPFGALVIDDKLETRKEAFLTEIPHLAQSNEIAFLKAEYHSDKYFAAIKKYAAEWDQILVSTDDTKANIDIAMKLCRVYDALGIFDSRPQIVVVLNDGCAGAKHLLDKYKNITVVDVNSRLMSYQTLIDRSVDLSAQDANANYNQLSNRGTGWSSLGTFLEASNRALALDVSVKKKLFAMSSAPQSDTMEFLAKYEHSRWMAFSFAHGWVPMPVSELTPEDLAEFNTKHADQKRHTCLIPWDELDKLPQKSPGKVKSYDRDTVWRALGNPKNV